MLWLVNYPGDLYVQYQQALNYANLGMMDQALSILKSLIELDPQFIEPYQALVQVSSDAKAKADWSAMISYLTVERPAQRQLPRVVDSAVGSPQGLHRR